MIPALIVPVLNRFDLLENFITSIDYPVKHLLIIDNSGNYQMPTDIYDGVVTVLNMPSNFGVAGSWNLGIKSFPFAPYWVIASNDVSFQPNQLEKFHKLSNPDLIIKSSQGWSCFSIGSNIIENVGLFDENFHPAYYEDVDYESRLQKLNLSSNITSSDIGLIVYDCATTIKDSESFFKKNIITNESNYQYWQNKYDTDDISAGQYRLQRRIDNDLFN